MEIDKLEELSFASEDFDLWEFCEKAMLVAEVRNRNGGIKIDPESMLKHCATEVGEAFMAFAKMKMKHSIANEKAFKLELGDIISCVVIISEYLDFDLRQILMDCYEKNRLRALGKGDKL